MRKASVTVCLTPGCDQADRNADGFCHLHHSDWFRASPIARTIQSVPNQAPHQLSAPNYQAPEGPEGASAELRKQEAALYLQLIEGQVSRIQVQQLHRIYTHTDSRSVQILTAVLLLCALET
jgi:hypothetical protein